MKLAGLGQFAYVDPTTGEVIDPTAGDISAAAAQITPDPTGSYLYDTSLSTAAALSTANYADPFLKIAQQYFQSSRSGTPVYITPSTSQVSGFQIPWIPLLLIGGAVLFATSN